MKIDELNNLDLRSDFENDNIGEGYSFQFMGYVGNRPDGCEDEEHEDDTWAIDSYNSDGMQLESYLYNSLFEYQQDVEILKTWDAPTYTGEDMMNFGLWLGSEYKTKKIWHSPETIDELFTKWKNL